MATDLRKGRKGGRVNKKEYALVYVSSLHHWRWYSPATSLPPPMWSTDGLNNRLAAAVADDADVVVVVVVVAVVALGGRASFCACASSCHAGGCW